jgi:hypothetical protein
MIPYALLTVWTSVIELLGENLLLLSRRLSNKMAILVKIGLLSKCLSLVGPTIPSKTIYPDFLIFGFEGRMRQRL